MNYNNLQKIFYSYKIHRHIILLLLMCISYILSTVDKSYYFLKLNVNSSTVGIINVNWIAHDTLEANKDGTFSADSISRGHVVRLGKVRDIKDLTVECVNPTGGPDIQCGISKISITDSFGKVVATAADSNYILNGTNSKRILYQNLLLPPVKFTLYIYSLAQHLIPVFFIFFLLLFALRKNDKLSLVLLSFTGFYVYSLIVLPSVNVGIDALENINVASHFFSQQHYYSYVEYRGFAWFLLLWIIHVIAEFFSISFYYVFIIYGCVVFSLVCSYLLPRIVNYTTNMKVLNRNIIFLNIAMVFLYGKQFICPLPDITPVFFLLFAYALLLENPGNIKCLIIGLCITMCCLMRINYIAAMIIMILSTLFSKYTYFLHKRLYKRVICGAIILIPFIIFSFINSHYYIASLPIGISNHTQSQGAMFVGMKIQKTSPFEIADNKGSAILKQEGLQSMAAMNAKVYFGLIAKYPFDFLTMYTTRLFNGLDTRSSQVYYWYTPDSEHGKIFYPLVNYSLLFLGLGFLYRQILYGRQKLRFCLTVISIAAPSLLMVVSWVESRYFLSLAILITAFGTLTFHWQQMMRSELIVNYFIFMLICFTLSANIYNQSSGYFLF